MSEDIIKSYLDKQIRYAASKALNETGKLAIKDLQDEMERVFDRPTPYIKDGLRKTVATKDNLSITIAFKDKWAAGKGHGAADVLYAEVFGGQRQTKAYEVLLQEKGILPQGKVTVPGKGQRLNQYGNITGARITQILSVLQAFRPGTGFDANQSEQSKRRHERSKNPNKKSPDLFYQPATDELLEGIYERKGQKELRSVLIFVDQRRSHYRPLLRFEKIITETFDKNLQNELDKAIEVAIATAR